MKTKIFTIEGKEGHEIEMPKSFSVRVREDICQKCYELEKKWQPYAPEYNAGKKHSASGKLRHVRKAWKSQYGKGLARLPRKIFWRRGTQFYWVATEVASTRGGRRAHPPRVLHMQKKLKMNKKERQIAINSGLTATTSMDWVGKRYAKIGKIKVPIVLESGFLKLKAKEFFKAIKNHLPEDKRILLVIGNNESFKITGIDIRKINEVKMADLWPLGRLTVYTENAIKELGETK